MRMNHKFYCLNVCQNTRSRRFNTIFERMKISFKQFTQILYLHSQGFSDHDICSLLPVIGKPVSLKTVRLYTRTLRMMIHLYVQEKLSKLILPGPVEIDEACLYKLRQDDHGRLQE
jgi:hypothetical protein